MAKLTARGCYVVAAWKRGEEERLALRSDGQLLYRLNRRSGYTTHGSPVVDRETAKRYSAAPLEEGWKGIVDRLTDNLFDKGWAGCESMASKYSHHHNSALYRQRRAREARRAAR